MEEYSKGSTLWKLCSKKARYYLDSAKKNNDERIVARYIEDEQCRMRTQEQAYTQSDMEEFDRRANATRNCVASSAERA